MSKQVPGVESIERAVDFDRLGEFALLYRGDRDDVDQVAAVHREYLALREFFKEDLGGGVDGDDVTSDAFDHPRETIRVGPARRAWEDAFEAALEIVSNQGDILMHYDARNEVFLEGLRHQILKERYYILDDYEVHYLLAIQVVHDVLNEGIEEVRRIHDRLRKERLMVAGVPDAGLGEPADVDVDDIHVGATTVGEEPTLPAAAGEFTYLPRFRKDLMLSFAEVHGGREDLENEYRFLEDSVFRADVLKRIAEDDHPEDLRTAWHSNEVLRMYEDMYERTVEWFHGVLPGLLGFDHFPAYDGEVRPDSACTAED